MANTKLPDVGSVRLVTPPGRLSYPNLIVPAENRFNQKMEYSTTLFFRKEGRKTEQFKKLWKTTLIYAVNELGAKAVGKKDDKPDPRFAHPGLIDGDKTDKENQRGLILIRAKASQDRPPRVLGPDGSELKADEQHLVYAGANAALLLGLYFWQFQSGMGVSFNLRGVKLLGGGDSITGGESISAEAAAKEFDDAGLPEPERGPLLDAPKDDADGGADFNDDIPF